MQNHARFSQPSARGIVQTPRFMPTRADAALLLLLVSICLCALLGSGLFSRSPEQKPVQQQTVSKAPAVQSAEKSIGWKEVAQILKDLEKVKQETLEAITEKAQARTTATSPRK